MMTPKIHLAVEMPDVDRQNRSILVVAPMVLVLV